MRKYERPKIMKVRGEGLNPGRPGPVSRLPEKRPVIAAWLSFLGLSVGFVAFVLLVLHWAAPSAS